MAAGATLGRTGPRPPDVNDLVRVTIGGAVDDDVTSATLASEIPSRVEDVLVDEDTGRPRAYLIAAPWFAGDIEPPTPGTVCMLQWPTDRGLCLLQVSLLGQEMNAARLLMWRVRVQGEVERRERRRFVRAMWSMPVDLVVRRDLEALPHERRLELERCGVRELLPSLPESYRATMINLSEGGLLCLTDPPALPAHLPLLVRFTIDDTTVETTASVIRSEPQDPEESGAVQAGEIAQADVNGVHETALAFDNPDQYAELLRPLIFAAQLRARRMGLL